jgi:radical SAM superfamily enzyme YgiQ (UPF0313 family)
MPFERPAIIRPPSEWRSYYLPLTSGCSNNTCTFCGYYGSKLGIREPGEVRREIDALALYIQHGVFLPTMPDIMYAIAQDWDGKRVFLQDGDALVYPFTELKEVLEYLNGKFPNLERVAAYATPQDILRKSVEELRSLRELKLGILYMGVESGDDEVLKKIGKGVDYHQVVEAGRKMKEAGIISSVTVILGLAGIERSERHALETARILTDMDPDYAGALTLTLVPGTPLYKEYQRGDFHPISPFDSLKELKIIVENSDFSNCFFSSMHASNYLSIRGRLPDDKERMLRELEEVLARKDASLLRPEFLRGL